MERAFFWSLENMNDTEAPEIDLDNPQQQHEKTWSDKMFELIEGAVKFLRQQGAFAFKTIGDNASCVQSALNRVKSKYGLLVGRCSVHRLCLIPKIFSNEDPIEPAIAFIQSEKMLQLFPTPPTHFNLVLSLEITPIEESFLEKPRGNKSEPNIFFIEKKQKQRQV
jgi:hypothetical protein